MGEVFFGGFRDGPAILGEGSGGDEGKDEENNEGKASGFHTGSFRDQGVNCV